MNYKESLKAVEEEIFDLKIRLYENQELEDRLCKIITDNYFDGNINFIENIKRLQKNINKRGESYPLLNEEFYFFCLEHSSKILNIIKKVQSESSLFRLNYFGLETLRNKYLIRTHDNYQESVEFMFVRVALYIQKNKNNWLNFEKMYRHLREGYYTHATPTLFNAGCRKAQLASCFLLGTDDTLEDIMDTVKDTAIISKNAGGVGLHVSNIRSCNSYIWGTNGRSNGIPPLLKLYNSTATYVDQGGGKRNGSFAIYLEPHHADLLNFLEMKLPIGTEQDRARDLFYALWISDYFMQCVEENLDWFLMDPNECPGLTDCFGDKFETLYKEYIKEKRFVKQMKARELWIKILSTQIQTGTPYFLYKDRCNELSNQQNLGTIKSSNLCCEIIQYSDNNSYSCCNLASIALPKFLKENKNISRLQKENEELVVLSKEDCSFCLLLKGYLKQNNIRFQEYDYLSDNYNKEKYTNDKVRTFPQVFTNSGVFLGGFEDVYKQLLQPEFDFQKLGEITMELVDNLNTVIDINDYPLEKTKINNLENRPMSIGCQGLADVFQRRLEAYDSEDSRNLNRQIFECIYYHALKKSNEIAKEKNKTYDTYKGSPISKGLFHFDLYSKKASYPYKFHYDWNGLKQEILKYGTYNSLLVGLMPTASTSQILGNVESFEPLTSNAYVRRTLSGEFYIINRFLQDTLHKCNLWNEDMKDKLFYHKGSVANIKEIPNFLKNIFRTVWEISQKACIDMSSDRGYFVDQSQSFNLYLNESNLELLTKCHQYGFKKNLKTGSYYIRTRSAGSAANFFLTGEKEKELSNDCDNCSA